MKLPKINLYQCEHGCHTVTVDVDEGVTPFMMKCRATSRPDRPLLPELTGEDGECVGIAHSCFYPRTPKPKHIRDPEWEWFKPTKEEIEAECKKNPEHAVAIRAFYNGEQLMLRKRTDKEPIYHE